MFTKLFNRLFPEPRPNSVFYQDSEPKAGRFRNRKRKGDLWFNKTHQPHMFDGKRWTMVKDKPIV